LFKSATEPFSEHDTTPQKFYYEIIAAFGFPVVPLVNEKVKISLPVTSGNSILLYAYSIRFL